MSDNTMNELRCIAAEIERDLDLSAKEIEELTAPCGLPCFTCYSYLASKNDALKPLIAKVLGVSEDKTECPGCRAVDGKCPHLPMPCRVYPCVENKNIHNCTQCDDFPCDFLHPYADKAFVWHNTKVFHLCLIKKMGLEKWAKEKAAKVRDRYSFEEWRL